MIEESVFEVVERMLSEHPECRDNYNLLIVQVWRAMGLEVEVDWKGLGNATSSESITRACRKIQEGKHFPSEAVMKKRKEREWQIRNQMVSDRKYM